MFDAFVGNHHLAVDMFYWSPTIVYDSYDCVGPAHVVPVPAYPILRVLYYRKALLSRGWKIRISSVMVPPGYKLELYEKDFDSAKYLIIGKMRDDGAGILCHSLEGTDFDDTTSQL